MSEEITRTYVMARCKGFAWYPHGVFTQSLEEALRNRVPVMEEINGWVWLILREEGDGSRTPLYRWDFENRGWEEL